MCVPVVMCSFSALCTHLWNLENINQKTSLRCRRLGEHKDCMGTHRAALKRDDRLNGITVHEWDHDHRVDWEATRVREEHGLVRMN